MFRNDYSEIAPREVLEALTNAASRPYYGYGEDDACDRAKALIRRRFSLPDDACIEFLTGGTQTNMTVISYLLRPYEGVLACDTGHINVHETAAVEASGHKVIPVKNHDGKLLASDIDDVMAVYNDVHMVKPGMVYLSDATETGTLYTASELKAIRESCDRHGLYLFLDGARLGIALTNEENDVKPSLLGKVCDAFYIGGTKNGLLSGEAVVFPSAALAKDFRYHIKNRGAMLAKGFVQGIQFEALFTDDLFFRLASHANEMAKHIREELKTIGIPFVGGSVTNQIFILLPQKEAAALEERFGCEVWEKRQDGIVMRIVTSFASSPEECEEFIAFVKNGCR